MTDIPPTISSKPPQDPRIGALVQDRYRITRRIGEGGMGVVYEGENIAIGKRVAIKSIHPFLFDQDETIERFHREARAAAAIGNEHIIDVFDMGVFDDFSPFMVMEYLEGHNLDFEIDSLGQIDLGRMVRIVGQICDAIRAAHEKGIVHRDLKPENVFLVSGRDNPDFVKILDFGVTKFKDSLGDKARLTATGAIIGTPQFMAPEQIEKPKSVDHRTDIYAIGVILYYALSGTFPFLADTAPMLILRICQDTPPSLRELVPGIPAEVSRIVMKALEKDPDQRFQNCQELKEQLWPYRSPTEPPPTYFSVPPTPVPSKPPIDLGLASTSQGSSLISALEIPSQKSRLFSALKSTSQKTWLFSALTLVVFITGIVMWTVANRSTPQSIVMPEKATHEPEQASISTQPSIEKVRVKLAVTPIDAQLFIDGIQIENPLNEERLKSKEPHRLEAKRAGYETLNEIVYFDVPRDLQLALKPIQPEIDNAKSESSGNTTITNSKKVGKKVSQRTEDKVTEDEPLNNKPDIKPMSENTATSDIAPPADSHSTESSPSLQDEDKPAGNNDRLLPDKDLIRIR